MADLGEEVVLDLIVQSAEQPGQHSAALSEVDRRSHLMHRPGMFHAASIAYRQRKRRLLITMGKLKDHAQNNAGNQHDQAVEEQDHPPLVEEHGDHESEREEDNLADDEDDQIPALGAGVTVLADLAGDVRLEVVEQMPLKQNKPIERPKVDVLPAMEAEPFLVWRKPAEEAELNIVVVAGDVGVSVMEDTMLPVPHVAAAPDDVDRPRHELVDPADVGIGPVPGVVLDVEPDAGGGQGQHNGERNGCHPTGRYEDQQDIAGYEGSQDERRL